MNVIAYDPDPHVHWGPYEVFLYDFNPVTREYGSYTILSSPYDFDPDIDWDEKAEIDNRIYVDADNYAGDYYLFVQVS